MPVQWLDDPKPAAGSVQWIDPPSAPVQPAGTVRWLDQPPVAPPIAGDLSDGRNWPASQGVPPIGEIGARGLARGLGGIISDAAIAIPDISRQQSDAAGLPPPPQPLPYVDQKLNGLPFASQGETDPTTLFAKIRQYGQKLVAENPASFTEPGQFLANPGAFVTESVTESLPELSAYIASRYLGPAVTALSSYGGTRDRQRTLGIDEPGKAASAAVLAAALERFGVERYLPGGAKLAPDANRLIEAGKGSVVAAPVEAGTEGLTQIAETYAGGDDPLSPAAIKRTLLALEKGAVGGAALGTLRGLAAREPAPPAPEPSPTQEPVPPAPDSQPSPDPVPPAPDSQPSPAPLIVPRETLAAVSQEPVLAQPPPAPSVAPQQQSPAEQDALAGIRRGYEREINLARTDGEAATLDRLADSDPIRAAIVYREAFGKTEAQTQADFSARAERAAPGIPSETATPTPAQSIAPEEISPPTASPKDLAALAPPSDARFNIAPQTEEVIQDAQTQDQAKAEAVLSPPSEGVPSRPRLDESYPLAAAKLSGWANAPEVQVYDNPKDAPFDAPEDARGAYYDGKVHLFKQNIADDDDAVRVLLHETVGHRGLRGTLGDGLNSFLDRVARERPADIQRLRQNLRVDERTAAEEFMAEMAETGKDMKFLDRAIVALNTTIRKVFPKLKLSRAELREVLVRSRKWTERAASETQPKERVTVGVQSETTEDAPPLFSRTPKGGPSLLQSYKNKASAVISRVEKYTEGIHGLEDQDVFMVRRLKALGSLAKYEKLGAKITAGFKGVDSESLTASFRYLTTAGAQPASIKNTKARDNSVAIKKAINQISDDLVAHGLIPAESREALRDRYLPQLYFKYLLGDGLYADLQAGKLPSNMGYGKQRKLTEGVDDEVMEVVLGRVKDPGFLSSVAVVRPLRDMALLDWLNDISANEKWVLPKSVVDWKGQKVTPYWLLSEAAGLRTRAAAYDDPKNAKAARLMAEEMESLARQTIPAGRVPQDYKQIPNTPRHGRLRGMYVRTPIYDDLIGMNDIVPDGASLPERILGYGSIGTTANQFLKTTKVALNPPAQVRNIVSNGFLLQLSGIPWRRIVPMLRRAIIERKTEGAYYKGILDRGLSQTTFASQELLRVQRDLLELAKAENRLNHWQAIRLMGARISDLGSKAYSFSEEIFKTAKYIHGIEYEGLSQDKAALEANRWVFDYSNVPRGLRYLRNIPGGAPFVTFTAKVAPRLLEVVLLHPQRLLPLTMLYYAYMYGMAEVMDIDKEDLDKLKKAAGEHIDKAQTVFIKPWKNSDGTWSFVNLDYFFPWSGWTHAGQELLSGDPLKAAGTLGLKGGFLGDIYTAESTGRNAFTGQEIAKKGDPFWRRVASRTEFAWGTIAPPFLSEYGARGKFIDAYLGTQTKAGDDKEDAVTAALSLIGINVNRKDPEFERNQQLRAMTYDILDVVKEARYKLSRAAPEKRSGIREEYRSEMKLRAAERDEFKRESTIAPQLR